MKKPFKWIWYAVWLLICLVGGGGTLFSWMPRTPAMFYGGCAMLILSAMIGTWLLMLAKGKPFQKALLPGILAGAAYAGILALTVYLCDEVIYKNSVADYQPVHSSLIAVCVSTALTAALIVLIPKKYDPKLTWLKRGIALVLACVALALGGLPQNYWWGAYKISMAQNVRLADPVGFSSYTEPDFALVEDADFYVAVDGNDENDGSFEKPFATIERARDVIRTMDKTGRGGITVAIKSGEYRIDSLIFTEADSGTESCPITYCAYGDGEVIFNAGVSIDPADFTAVTDEAMLSRLQESVRDKILCVDLREYGLTAEDIGKIYSFGEVTTAGQYDGDYLGDTHCELFVNDSRQTIARYPNEGWLNTGAVLEHGEPWETVDAPHVKVEGWLDLRNPRGDTYALTQEEADRVNGWQDLRDVWMFGYFTCTWGYGTTLIENFDYENRSITTKFVAVYGAHEGRPYYYFNVFEELDTQGEWYLDRENCVLYLYAPEDMDSASIELTVSTDTMVTVENAKHLTFRGLTFQGTRGDAIVATGDDLTVEYCLIHNIGGTAITLTGSNNLAANNEITRVGEAGIRIDGGDFDTLTPGNNRAYNNLVYEWGQVEDSHGISVTGVGNQADHNELHHYGDMGIRYDGMNLLIEYNLIYSVSLQSSDSGAIYTGLSWINRGSIVRYNAIYNMGTTGVSTPNGIYLDDGVGGQTVYGNLLVNIPDNGILVGGGRDNNVYGNMILNTGNSGISYDQRTFSMLQPEQADSMWQSLQDSAWQTEAWQQAYPYMQGLHKDEANADSPMYILNPANSNITGNLLVNWQGELGEIMEKPAQYSNFDGNAVYGLDMLEAIFVDPDKGDYRMKEDSIVYELIPDFEELPIDKMGRE